MTSQPALRLAQDHAALDEVLKQLQQVLDARDLQGSLGKLDLFWARLAVHIRAEHHHLFPAVLNCLRETKDRTGKPTLGEAEATVDRLRADHDFFMHELAHAIRLVRGMAASPDSESLAYSFEAVENAVVEIEKRLLAHNEIEEAEIYNWATTLFDQHEQRQLCTLINDELAYHPPRFTTDEWLNSTADD